MFFFFLTILSILLTENGKGVHSGEPLRRGQEIKVIGTSSKRGFLIAQIGSGTMHVPFQLTELKTVRNLLKLRLPHKNKPILNLKYLSKLLRSYSGFFTISKSVRSDRYKMQFLRIITIQILQLMVIFGG